MESEIIAGAESHVRSYSRAFPVVFDRARGTMLYDVDGNGYLDFLAGAGSLNYGHNNPLIRQAIIEHLERDAITQSLDLFTVPKAHFLLVFSGLLDRLGLPGFRVQFVGPTGTNAVEAALKLSRKATGRSEIVAFSGAFHGASLGSLAVCGEVRKRRAAGVSLPGTIRMPYPGTGPNGFSSVDLLDSWFSDPNSGVSPPAAFIIEAVQGEGGLNAAPEAWLRDLASLAKRHGSLLILDEIQSGCGRTGDFFAFGASGIRPDLICVSKSISGFGLPMALVLIDERIDVWEPGEHNGTFRGSAIAFSAATATLSHFWSDDSFAEEVRKKAEFVNGRLDDICRTDPGLARKGRGLMTGLRIEEPGVAVDVSRACFRRRLVVETCGSGNSTLKLLPPLTASESELDAGLRIIAEAVDEVLSHPTRSSLERVA